MQKFFIFALSALLAAALTIAPAATSADSPPGQAAKLRNAITLAGIMSHEQAFQEIANANGGTRAAGTPGFDASVAYVVEQLEAAGYDPQVQEFEFPFFEQLAPSVFQQISPNPQTYVENTDYSTMMYSGSGDVIAHLQEVERQPVPARAGASSSNAGCEPEDFVGFVPGNIALIQRGTCTFHDKALNAQNAGASAVLIFNEGQPGRTDVIGGTLGTPEFHIPALDTSFAQGAISTTSSAAGRSRSTSAPPPIRNPRSGERPRGHAGRRPEPRRRAGLAPRLGPRGPGHQRQRVGLGVQPRVGDPARQEQHQAP